MKIFLILAFCFIRIFAFEVSPGEVLALKIKNLDANQTIRFLEKRITPFALPQQKDTFVLLLPIDYKALKGTYLLSYYVKGKKVLSKIKIEPKVYEKEILHVDPKKVKPPKKFQNQIYKEYKQAIKIYKTSTKKRYWQKPFILPLHSNVTSKFGNARIYNGSLKGYHSGTDFRAKIGTPVIASNDGIVVIAQKRYYAGGSVVIDHGYGVYSCYYHLSKISVKVGERVSRRQIVGLSGQSGRVNGPHLHFGIRIYNTNVNPLEFLSQMNALLHVK
jgi:murein DD-endopeptidase MepM/ murein hydrolase activator NlpD